MDDYFPWDDWVRNYRAMSEDKLRDCMSDFHYWRRTQDTNKYAEKIGMTLRCQAPNAVQRVMDHGGDIEANIKACKNEARRRGILVV